MFLSGKKETVLKDLFIILLPFIFFSGCQAALLQLKAPLEEEGEVYLYINPFPQEADRLRFKIVEIIALSGDGREFPLSVSLHEFKGPEVKNSGSLPPVNCRQAPMSDSHSRSKMLF